MVSSVRKKGRTATDKNASIFDSEGDNPVELVLLEKGRLILDLYTIEADAIVGGMGRVFRVHNPILNVDLALKQPRAELFKNKKQKKNFASECENWIKLGLHPNIVSCYYVREINGIPSIFSEWMDGGSLKEYIESKALYKGRKKEVLERILDISIQFARGLHYAHEQDLIHQDVKPANLLLTTDGRAKTLTAKVCDFGIAGAREKVANANGRTDSSDSNTVVVNGHAYTHVYRSPEQKDSIVLTRRTDVWSWAVSVLEMFIGKRLWSDGAEAGNKCEDNFVKKMRVSMPESIKDLLRHCFRAKEADRPHDFGVVEAELLLIYQAETGNAYPRPKPKAASNSADSLNNKALSFYDIGKSEEAEKCWAQALDITSNHIESLYNQSIHLWKTGQIDDIEVLRRISENRTNMTDYYLAKIHLLQYDAECAIACLNKVERNPENTEYINKLMYSALEMKKTEKNRTCIHTIEEGATSACFSPDGKIILSSSDDSNIYLWDVATWECILTFIGHTKSVRSVCFSSDGKTALSCSSDKTIKLWDTATRLCLHTFSGHTDSVTSACFSRDGKKVFSHSWDKTVKIWDLVTGECLHTFYIFSSLNSACLSPDGKMILLDGNDYQLRLLDVETGQCVRTFSGHTDYVTSVSFSPDGKMVLSSSYDETIILWNAVTGQKIRIFKGHTDNIESVCYSPNGKTALSGSSDKTVRLWDISTGQCICTFLGHTSKFSRSVETVSFSPDGKIALSCSMSEIKMWSIPNKPDYEMVQSKVVTTETELHNTGLFDSLIVDANTLLGKGDVGGVLTILARLPEKRILVSNSKFVELKKQTGRYCVLSKINHVTQTKSLAQKSELICISPDGETALSGCFDNTFKLWDIRTGECLRIFKGHTHHVNSIRFSPRGNMVLSGSDDKTIKLWDVKTGECIQTFEKGFRFVNSVRFSSDGMTVLSDNIEQATELWDEENWRSILLSKGNVPNNTSCLSPNKKIAILINSDRTFELWNIASKKCIYRSVKSVEFNRYSFCFSPDGTQFLVAGGKEILIYDIDYELYFPGWEDWSDDVLSFVQNFLTFYPNYTYADFKRLITELQNHGYGWLRPKGVKSKLQELSGK